MARILYIITKSEAGGAQTHITQLCAYLQNSGHAVAVMSSPGGRSLLQSGRKSWLQQQVERLDAKFYANPYLKNSYNPLWGFKALPEIRKAIKMFKPDLVSCHSSVAGFWARLAIQDKIPTFFTAHGWAFTDGAPFFRRAIAIFSETIAARWAKKIICVSEFDRQLALKYGVASKEKLVTVHNGVERDSGVCRNERDEGHGGDIGAGNLTGIEAGGKKDTEKVRIVFVGRLSKQKAPELLLQAFCELPQGVQSKAQITIIGDGPKKDFLKLLISRSHSSDRVHLLGALPRNKVFEVLSSADVFILTSYYEGFPRTILEAMSVGLPVIASDVGGVSEAVVPETGHLIIKRGDKEALKKALVELIENPDLRRRMGEAGRKQAREKFSLERMIRETLRVTGIEKEETAGRVR